MGFETLMKLQGFRTTLCFIIVTLCASAGLFSGFILAAAYLDFMKWAFGLYVGAKAVYKGTEVAKANINAKTG